MRLNLRRVQPGALFGSFMGILDIKLGCEIVLLFGLINKVAGVYGLITVLVGGTFVQFLFYAYSVVTLFAFLWALGVIKSETAHKTLLVAHLYTADHVIQSVFHYLFYYHYWFVEAHDGKRILNSQAQKDIVELAASRGEITPLSGTEGQKVDEIQAQLAQQIWSDEKGYALGLIIFGFLLKVYFMTILYSYAAHLRSSTYHTLSYTTHANGSSTGGVRNTTVVSSADDDDRELANAEAEVARLTDEANGSASGNGSGHGKAKAREGRKSDDDDFNWE